jgi:hypothetical protein
MVNGFGQPGVPGVSWGSVLQAASIIIAIGAAWQNISSGQVKTDEHLAGVELRVNDRLTTIERRLTQDDVDHDALTQVKDRLTDLEKVLGQRGNDKP